MLKNISIILILWLTNNAAAQEIRFQVDFSENYAVFEFARYLSPGYPPNAFKKVFENSKYNTAENLSLINDFNDLNYFYWYEYPQYPYGSKIGGNTYFLLSRNLIESKTLEEFKAKSFGIIPNNDLNLFYESLSTLLPVYRALIYRPCEAKFKAQLKALQTLINSEDVSFYFNQVIDFHRSSWDHSISFTMSLYPIPDERSKGFTATAFYNLAVAGIPQGLKDYELLLSVMNHEAFHILYDEQSLSVKNDMARWFDESTSGSSRYAQLLFNEAITTALANGHVYREMKGTHLEGAWYNNEYIAMMARSLYPLVREYLDAKRPIDRSFIEAYIEVLEQQYSGWINELPHLFMNRFIVTDRPEDYNALSRLYRYNNIEEYRDQVDELALAEMKKTPVSKVIVVSNDHKRKLQLVKNTFRELSYWKIPHDTEFCRAIFLRDRTYLIIINKRAKGMEDLLRDIQFYED